MSLFSNDKRSLLLLFCVVGFVPTDCSFVTLLSPFFQLSRVSDWKRPAVVSATDVWCAFCVCVCSARVCTVPALSPVMARRLGRQGNELCSVAPLLLSLMTLWKVALKDAWGRGFLFFSVQKVSNAPLKHTVTLDVLVICGDWRRWKFSVSFKDKAACDEAAHVEWQPQDTVLSGDFSDIASGNEGPQRAAGLNPSGTLFIL